MVRAMLTCEQTRGQSVYQHGMSVWQHFLELKEHLKDGRPLDAARWRMPDWIERYRRQIVATLHDDETINQYTLYHDCGKSCVRVVDDQGRVHFPDHAEVSAAVWEAVGGDRGVGLLIRHDMAVHTESAERIAELCETVWSARDAVTLFIVGLCEVHSNAKLFGGTETPSFKAKWKKVCQRGKQICQKVFDNPEILCYKGGQAGTNSII